MMVNTDFRRQADAHLKDKYQSGDDIFLLQYAIAQGKKIVYVKHPDAAVYTHSPKSLGELIRQRARWAGKTVGYTDIITIAVAAVVLLANIAILAAAALWVADVIRWYMFLILWGIKTIADAFAVIAPSNLSNIHVKLHDLILLSLIYPIYTVVCVVRGVIPRSSSDCWRRADG